MTMQRTDSVEFHGATYFLIGGTGGPLATPEYFAMKAEMLSTACYRGYYAVYAFVSDTLVLRDFTLRSTGGIYHALNGVKAQGLPAQGTYRGLELIIPYTGILRLTREVIPELNDLRPQPLAYREVLDLTLDQGHVLATRDRSAEAEELRRRRQAGETIGNDLAYDRPTLTPDAG